MPSSAAKGPKDLLSPIKKQVLPFATLEGRRFAQDDANVVLRERNDRRTRFHHKGKQVLRFAQDDKRLVPDDIGNHSCAIRGIRACLLVNALRIAVCEYAALRVLWLHRLHDLDGAREQRQAFSVTRAEFTLPR